MRVKTHDIFPTRLWTFELPELSTYHHGWREHIQAWRDAGETPAGRSNRQGWNSDKTVFNKEGFLPLKQGIQSACRHVFQEMQLTQELNFALEGWVNLHDRGGFNMLHCHPNVLLSGCYYLDVPEQAGPILFRDPRPGMTLIQFPGRGIHCGSQAALKPRPGQLIVFPNWLEHKVEPNESDEPRIAIAFNAIRD